MSPPINDTVHIPICLDSGAFVRFSFIKNGFRLLKGNNCLPYDLISCDSHRYFRRYAGTMNVKEFMLMPMAELVSKNKYLFHYATLLLHANLLWINIIGRQLATPCADFLKSTTIQVASPLAIPSACNSFRS